jgi:hypothetical protein
MKAFLLPFLAAPVAAAVLTCSRQATACPEYCTTTVGPAFQGLTSSASSSIGDGEFWSTKGPAVKARYFGNSGETAVFITSSASSEYAAMGTAPGNGGTGSYAAVYGNATGSGGTGVLAIGQSFGVYGYTDSGTNSAGVVGYNSGTGGFGVYGSSSGGFGVQGTDSSSGAGVYGWSDTGNGVVGVNATTSRSTNKAAVYGQNNSTGYAGLFVGPVYVNGAIYVNSCTSCSDAKLKRSVQPLVGALSQLLQLRGVTFEWKDPAKYGHERETGTQRGFIAQDVEKVFPQWVDDRGYVDRDGQAFRTIDLHQIEALEVEGIREIKVKADTLREAYIARRASFDAGQQGLEQLERKVDLLSRHGARIPGRGAGAGVLGLGALGCLGAIGLVLTRRRRPSPDSGDS